MSVKWIMFVGLCMPVMMQAAAYGGDLYEPGTGITQVAMTAPADGSSVAAEATVTASCTTAADTDVCKATSQPVTDPVTHTWSGSGSFDPGTGTSVNWTAPTAAGDATITVTADDSPLADEQPTTASVTVKVVRVSKIQYNDPDSGYTDAPSTLYVMKGTTVTFKAIKDPADEAWPDGKPVWGGTGGASGTGETKAVTFNATGDKTVTAECGNTVTVNVKVYELTGHHIAQNWFTGRNTVKYGAAEGVSLSFTVNPTGITATQMGGLSWTQVAGSGTLQDAGNGLGTYFCHWTTDSVTLRLSVQSGPSKNMHADMAFTVVPPSGVVFVPKPGSGIRHFQGLSSCGFLAWSYLTPKDVSFTRTDYHEGTCNATLNGWYAAKCPGGLTHPANGPWGVGDGNATTGCLVDGDDQVYDGHSSPPAYAVGWYTWVIPQNYSVGGGGQTQITTLTHRADIDAAGKKTIQKGAVGPVSKNVNDPDSEW